MVAAATYAVQAAGCMAFVAAGGVSVPLMMAGVVLFVLGNVTSLPPLIAQSEFAPADVPAFFIVAALIQLVAAAAYLAGRTRA
ncbi:MAG TPA: hypothetical protein VK862_16985 [Afifellaceae bacterium]|nr:hypothetical protein [Afifellaceae bacterium]